MAAKKIKARRKKTEDRWEKEVRGLIADPALHRRILRKINDAVRPEDLLANDPVVAHVEGEGAIVIDDHGLLPIDKKAEVERVISALNQVAVATPRSAIVYLRTESPARRPEPSDTRHHGHV